MLCSYDCYILLIVVVVCSLHNKSSTTILDTFYVSTYLYYLLLYSLYLYTLYLKCRTYITSCIGRCIGCKEWVQTPIRLMTHTYVSV